MLENANTPRSEIWEKMGEDWNIGRRRMKEKRGGKHKVKKRIKDKRKWKKKKIKRKEKKME